MQSLVITLMLVFTLSACQSTGLASRPVFGADNRSEVIHSDAQVCKVGSAVLAIFSEKDLERQTQGTWRLVAAKTLSDRGWCSSMRFAGQPGAARCTGFLIASDLLVTAGHCIVEQAVSTETGVACSEALLVLDFKLSITRRPVTEFSAQQVFGCQELIAGTDSRLGPDWRVVRLDRASNRTPLSVYGGEPLAEPALLEVVGHPLGLPMKSADQGRIIGYSRGRYHTNLDTFRGNSGSPVFTLIGGRPVVVGVMSGGINDRQRDAQRQCDVERICSAADQCRGQLATDARMFVEWAAEQVFDTTTLPPANLVADCAWCQDPLRSRFWQCSLAGTLE